MSNQFNVLRRKLAHCMQIDKHALSKRLQRCEASAKTNKLDPNDLMAVDNAITQSNTRLQQRRNNRPTISFPETLPIVSKREVIADAITKNQVVIICGETGSGKTTQLPKICLDIGRGITGYIGHTQPRRVAARSIASRIAAEVNSTVGQAVGYKIRFSDRTHHDVYIKLMTDGILLAETQNDKFLQQYDTLILDEAHERSLNIDFLMGYLKQLLPKRRDLKLIITSATIDPERFAHHFNQAPIIEVSGRTYPVDIHYQPIHSEKDQDADLSQAIVDAVDDVSRMGRGDCLIFLPGEREIRETAEALRKHHPTQTEILPLYARLSHTEQEKVFKPHHKRRIILATNVAETSLTVPGIRYVIDSGLARISRYSYRTKVQRLPIEPISQASANQRAGRCGRLSAGVCIRLYSVTDFQQRPEFIEPEILRTNLASVILQMQALNLGDIQQFPFVEAPDTRLINAGYQLLFELGATNTQNKITALGRQLAKLPIDPKLARLLLAAQANHCTQEMLVIAAALSVPDPRERPFDKQQQADTHHQRFHDPESDFTSILKLWKYIQEQEEELSNNQFRKRCQAEYLSYLRIREWKDIYQQLKTLILGMGHKINQTPADYTQTHQALLTGLLGNIGFKTDPHQYTGARNTKFNIFPGSALFKQPPKWVIASEIVDTGKVYARTVAKIDPQWIEPLAPQLIKKHYDNPHWEKRPAQVAAFERVTLYGLTLISHRKINYGSIDPVISRELFIRGALVNGEYQTQAAFFQHNFQLIEQIEALESKSRRQDILVDEATLFQFYDTRIPENIYSGASFEVWHKSIIHRDPQLLHLTLDDLMRHDATEIDNNQFPDDMIVNGIEIPLQYHFEPGHERDGVTATIPVAALNQLNPEVFESLVPGLLKEKITLLIKSLPKNLRRNFVPAPHFAETCLHSINFTAGELIRLITQHLQKITNIAIPIDAWQTENIPAHFFMNFVIIDDKHEPIAMSRHLSQLQNQFAHKAKQQFASRANHAFERNNITGWDFGDLPESIRFTQAGVALRGYPAIADQTDSVALQLVDSPPRAANLTRYGLRRLFMLQSSQQVNYLHKNLPNIQRICLLYSKIGACNDLKNELINAIVDAVFITPHESITTQDSFEQALTTGNKNFIDTGNTVCADLEKTLSTYAETLKHIKKITSPTLLRPLNDINQQLQHLIYPGFIEKTPLTWLPHLPRYLQAIQRRLSQLNHNLDKDQQHSKTIAPYWQTYLSYIEPLDSTPAELEHFRWMIEELRVSLYAQALKTRYPVSEKRLQQLWQEITNK